MLARLILALLLAVFAVPAVAPAACHEVRGEHAATMAMHEPSAGAVRGDARDGAHDAAPDDPPAPSHGCIGCIPPSNWTGARIADMAPHEAATLVERAAVLDLRASIAPRLRPPRDA